MSGIAIQRPAGETRRHALGKYFFAHLKSFRSVFWTARVTLLAFAVVGLAACEDPADKERAHMERGIELFTSGDHARAAIEFKNAAQLNPKNGDALYYIGRIHEAGGRWREAFAAYYRATDRDPKHIDANLRSAKFLIGAGSYDDALARIAAAMAENPANAEAYAVKAAAHARMDLIDDAIGEAEKSLELVPGNPSGISVLAGIYRKQNRLGKSTDILNEGIELNPDNTSLRFLRAAIFLERGLNGKSEEELLRLLADYPDNTQVRHTLARMYIAWSQLDDAERLLREAAERDPENKKAKLNLVEFMASQREVSDATDLLNVFISESPDDYALRFGLADLYSRHEHRTEAMNVLQEIAIRDAGGPQSLKAMAALAAMRYASGEAAEARRLVDDILREDPANEQALLLDARLALTDLRYESAIKSLRGVLKSNPTSTNGLRLLSAVYLADKNTALALETLRRLTEIEPGDHHARLQLAQLLVRRGDHDGALKPIDEILAQRPEDIPALATKVDVLVLLGRLNEAREVAETVPDIADNRAIRVKLAGRIALADRRYDDASNFYGEAYAADPMARDVVSYRAQALILGKKFEEASAFLVQAVETDPQNAQGWTLLGDIRVQLDDRDAAILAYRSAIAAAPDMERPYGRLAGLLNDMDRSDEALAVLQQGFDANREVETMGTRLALAQQALGHYDGAIATYRTILDIHPQSIVAANNLAALVTDHAFQDKALLKETLHRVEPLQATGNPLILDTIGWLHYRLGDFVQATAFLERAVTYAPDNQEINYHIGKAYAAGNDNERARTHLQKALKGNETYPFTPAARETLDALPEPGSGS